MARTAGVGRGDPLVAEIEGHLRRHLDVIEQDVGGDLERLVEAITGSVERAANVLFVRKRVNRRRPDTETGDDALEPRRRLIP